VVRRSDQRAKGELYVRGLLSDGARKSMQPMAQRLGVDHQGLQQFVTSSTWDHDLVRANVARWAAEAIDPAVYVVDDSGFPKDGTASPCVARQYSGTLGKTGNCQIGVSIQMATDQASLAANWRLFCPASWDDTTVEDPQAAQAVRERRTRAGIPEQVRHREKWRLALDMFDQMSGAWELPKLPVVGDSGYGDATEFRLGLDERGFDYVLEVDPTAGAYPHDAVPVTAAYHGRGRPPGPGSRTSPSACGPWRWRPGVARCGRSPGGTARRRPPRTRARRCARGSWRSGSGRPIATSPAMATAACPNAG
jgi:SRSO17 transposase